MFKYICLYMYVYGAYGIWHMAKVVKIGKLQDTDRINIDEVPIEEVMDFGYLGSAMSSNIN